MNNERCTAEQQCSGTITRGTETEHRLNFNSVPIATVNVSSDEEPTLIETSNSNISTTITNQPTYDLPELPYTSPAGLIYDQGSVEEIRRHIDGQDIRKSQYEFRVTQELLGNQFTNVIDMNDQTYLNGVQHLQDNGNTSFIYAFPAIEAAPIFFYMPNVGYDTNERDNTNVNTLIVYPDGYVTTSHPGFPTEYNGNPVPNVRYLRDMRPNEIVFTLP